MLSVSHFEISPCETESMDKKTCLFFKGSNNDAAYTNINNRVNQGYGLLREIHVKIHVSEQGFSNMDYDWLVAMLPVNHMPCLKFFN